MLNSLRHKIYNLLRKSEKWTQTDMVYLAKGGFWLTLGQIVSSISSFLLAIAFANLLPKETYGTYKYVLSIVSVLAIPTLSGINISLTRSVARGFEGSMIIGLKTKMKWGLLGGIASILVAGYYWVNGNHLLAFGFLISAIFIPFMDSFGVYNSLFNGRRDFRTLTKYKNVAQVISVISMIAIMFLTKNLLLILATYFTINTFLRLIFLTISLKKIKNKNTEKGVSAYGLQLSILKGASIIAGSVNSVFLFHFLGSRALAVFSIAIAPTEQIRSLLRNLESLLLPKLSQNEWKIPSLKNIIKKSFPLILSTAFISITFIVLAPWLFGLFFPAYSESISYAQFAAPTLVLTSFNIFLHNILLSKKKIREQKYLTTLNILTSFIITIPLIYYFKINGLITSIYINKSLEIFLTIFLLFKNPILSRFKKFF